MRALRGVPPLVIVVLLALAPYVLAVYPLQLLAQILIYGILAISLDLLLGYTGLASLGHALYFGFAGYTVGLVAIHVTSNALVGLVVGAAAGAVSALATGWLAIRSRSVYFIMLTLAFSELAASVATSWSSLTGGDQGLIGIPPASLPNGVVATGVINPVDFYWYALVVGVIAYVILRAVTRSSFGLALVGIRENEHRMRSLGYPTFRFKFIAYIVAGTFAGLAGALYVQYSDLVAPDYIGFELSALVLVMVMVGGGGTLYGGVLGAVVVVILQNELSARFQQWEMVLGIVFIVIVYLMPSGLAGLLRAAGRAVSRIVPWLPQPPGPVMASAVAKAPEPAPPAEKTEAAGATSAEVRP
jgi:branched-chain amino acid transport system permease protein